MNTFLSPAQQATKEQYEAYAKEKIEPIAQTLEDGTAAMRELLTSLGQAGYLGLSAPKEYGGQDGSFLHTVLFAEAAGRYQPAVALALAAHTAAIELINRFGTSAQKSRYLPLLSRGETIGTMALTETGSGTDFKAAATTAAKDSDHFIIDGTKTWVVNGDIAGLAIVSARTADDGTLSLLLVELNEANTLKIDPNHAKLGMRALSTNDLQFASHKVSSAALLSTGSDDVDEQILFASDISKTMVAAAALGMLETVMYTSAAHANTREQFGQKLSQFQAIQWKLADMSTESAAARLITYRAAWSKEGEPETFRKNAAMAKWYASKCARFHVGEAVQTLGLHGIEAGSAAERFYRDAKMTELCEGTSEFQKIIIAQELGV